MSIGENIRQLRKRYNISQNELGEIAGVTGKAVSTWENDVKMPRMKAIQRIADYFEIDISDILSGERLPEDIDFALFSEAKTLTDEQKQSILSYIKFLQSSGNSE